jgi:hypothetical protein
MTVTTKPFPFSNVSRILELKTIYDEHHGQLSLPSNRRSLNSDNAEWFVKSAKRFNKQDNAYKFLLKTCEEYVELGKVRYEVPNG